MTNALAHFLKILNPLSIFIIGIILVLSAFLIRSISASYPSVLGESENVTVRELLDLTNRERQKNGLSPLKLDEKLTRVANNKSKDILEKNYWAHNAPDGTTPWDFFDEEGYKYSYAGENLARGFSTAEEAINAWMRSEKHKENILSPNFVDIGFSIREGKIKGEETILIVQAFGSQGMSSGLSSAPLFLGAGKQTESLLNRILISRGVIALLMLLLISAFTADMLIVGNKGIKRIVSHNVDHILFLMAMFAIGLFLARGIVL